MELKNTIPIFEFQVYPTLKHQDLVIFTSILENEVRFENLLKCSSRKCNQNFAISRRLGVGSISAGWVRPVIGIKIIAADI